MRDRLAALLAADAGRLRLLTAVASRCLPDAWIGAGVVRGAVWDHLHEIAPRESWDDIDVIWFDPACASTAADIALARQLRATEPGNWSVHNQARMHVRNGNPPYRSTTDAVARWPETATAVAARLHGGGIEILAPHGLDDLFGLVLRSTSGFAGDRRTLFAARVREKRWQERWPRLVIRD